MKRIFCAVILFVLCLGIFPTYVRALTASREAELQAELDQIEKEKVEIQKNLDTTRQQTSSIARDTAVLTAEINQSKLNIKEKNIRIEQLGKDITVKTKRIGELSTQIDQGKKSLGQIIKKLNEIDRITLPEIVLSQNNLSETLIDIDTFNSVNHSLENMFSELRGTQTTTEKERSTLDQRKNSELDAKAAILTEQRNVQKKEAEKKVLLTLSKQKEANYAQVLSQREKRAQQIRDALFELRDSNGVPFGTALEYAKKVSSVTGVRPAFLLAILTQETNLGKNIGSCLMTDLDSGAGKGKNTGTVFEKVMKPPRDTNPFKLITSALGRDWKTTPVSCPIGGTAYYVGRGFGGAMGPAQFIPSTWVLFENRIEKALGVNQADPWKPSHAFMASGLYLSDLGGGGGAYSSEIKAACKYYGSGGSTCTYGTQVMAKAANIQENMINVLDGN